LKGGIDMLKSTDKNPFLKVVRLDIGLVVNKNISKDIMHIIYTRSKKLSKLYQSLSY